MDPWEHWRTVILPSSRVCCLYWHFLRLMFFLQCFLLCIICNSKQNTLFYLFFTSTIQEQWKLTPILLRLFILSFWLYISSSASFVLFSSASLHLCNNFFVVFVVFDLTGGSIFIRENGFTIPVLSFLIVLTSNVAKILIWYKVFPSFLQLWQNPVSKLQTMHLNISFLPSPQGKLFFSKKTTLPLQFLKLKR